jgi:hypothetical protein
VFCGTAARARRPAFWNAVISINNFFYYFLYIYTSGPSGLSRALPGSSGLSAPVSPGSPGLSRALLGSRSGLSRALGSVFLPRSFHISYRSVVEFLSAAPTSPTSRRHPRSPATQTNETSPDSGCFTCRRATRANPNRHFPESKDENWISNDHLAQFRTSVPITGLNPNRDLYTRF